MARAKREEEKRPITPLYGELPEKLTLRVSKAWRALARKLDEEELLTSDQWRKKGLIWKYVTLIPDKIKRYGITKSIKKLYGLTDGEYQDVKALLNVYGKYAPQQYDSARPLSDLPAERLRKFRRTLEDIDDESERYAEAA